ncbi:monocarboxylate transporter 11-like [Amphiura filiformis]|uniref:monocarboxylate transporter 11-like n=1 Tax=Amphiura filiformis TaxID=82378 RepID=UPI003B22233F
MLYTVGIAVTVWRQMTDAVYITLKSLAVLLPTLKDQFETDTWVIGTMIALMASARDITAPIVGILASNFNNRVLGMLGGTVIGVSTVCASFGYSVYVLLLLLSIINGISFALLLVPGYALLAQYFERHYSLAVGIVYASASFGLMVAAPVAQLLLDTYGWRGTLLILGGINFHLLFSGSLLRHQAVYQQKADSTITTKLAKNLQSWIYDHTGSYDAGFIFLGVIQAIGVLAIAADHMRQKMTKND